MSYNGSGTFLINTAGQPVVAGTTITATAFNTLTTDLANGLTNAICKDGQSTPTADISFGNNKITNLKAGTLLSDAARLSQVQDGSTIYLTSVSGTDTITGTAVPSISSYTAGNMFNFVAAGTNTGAATININGIGAVSITKNGATALDAGDISSGKVYTIVYDGAQFQVDIAGSISTPISIANGGTNAATESDARTNLGVPTGTSGAVLGFLDGANTWSGIQTLSVGADITPAATPSTTSVGYLGTPLNTQNTAYTFIMSDAGKTIYHTSATAHSYAIPANGSVAYPIGTIICIENESGAGDITLSINTDTLRWNSSTGTRTIAANGSAAIKKVDSTTWRLVGAGIT